MSSKDVCVRLGTTSRWKMHEKSVGEGMGKPLGGVYEGGKRDMRGKAERSHANLCVACDYMYLVVLPDFGQVVILYIHH